MCAIRRSLYIVVRRELHSILDCFVIPSRRSGVHVASTTTQTLGARNCLNWRRESIVQTRIDVLSNSIRTSLRSEFLWGAILACFVATAAPLIGSRCDPANERESGNPDWREDWPLDIGTSHDLDWADPLNQSITGKSRDDLLCETHRNDMVYAYVKSLKEDREMVMLPLGMGKSPPILMDLFGLNRALVLEAISTLESTIQQWNEPEFQIQLVGHPIVYEFSYEQSKDYGKKSPLSTNFGDSSSTVVPHLIHHPEFTIPWKVLEAVAEILMEDPRIAPGIFPKTAEKQIMINTLRVLSSILIDLVLSSSISLHGGLLEMKWTTVQPDKWQAYFDSMLDPAVLEQIIHAALKEIDFQVVEEQAKAAVQQQAIMLYGEEHMYAMAYKMMLIMFYLFHMGTEYRFLGRSIGQRFVRPPSWETATTSGHVSTSLPGSKK